MGLESYSDRIGLTELTCRADHFLTARCPKVVLVTVRIGAGAISHLEELWHGLGDRERSISVYEEDASADAVQG